MSLEPKKLALLRIWEILKEYSDFGMHDELKRIRDAFSSKLQKLSPQKHHL